MPLSEFYSRKAFNKEKGDYIYYNPECKECRKEKSINWRLENREAWLESNKRTNKKPEKKSMVKKAMTERRNEGKAREWQQNNKDKVKGYQDDRKHMIHKISKKEWIICKNFFNNSCAYCELSELEHYKLFNEQLQKDHVDPVGSNKIDNCVPACRRCNPSKSNTVIVDWYNDLNPNFTTKRMDKILYWLENYLIIINKNT